jgi:hypothetical protein
MKTVTFVCAPIVAAAVVPPAIAIETMSAIPPLK